MDLFIYVTHTPKRELLTCEKCERFLSSVDVGTMAKPHKTAPTCGWLFYDFLYVIDDHMFFSMERSDPNIPRCNQHVLKLSGGALASYLVQIAI